MVSGPVYSKLKEEVAKFQINIIQHFILSYYRTLFKTILKWALQKRLFC
jgi:hypothetical protein